MILRKAILLSLCAGILFLPGCHAVPTPQAPSPSEKDSIAPSTPVYGGVLTVCDGKTVDVLGYPAAMTSGSPIRHSAPALETLFQLDGEGNIHPMLALSYESDHDAGTLTLSLRQQVTFHDGSEYNAEAVKWNLEQQVQAGATGFSHVVRIEAIDDATIRIHLAQWDNTLLPSLCQAQGLIISPASYQKYGKEWAFSHPVGTGPFRFEQISADGTITYTRYENYWQEGKPYLDAVKIVCDSDSSSREYRFREGEYNVLIRGDITSLGGFSAEGYTVHSIASTGPWGLVFDSADETSPFADKRVRQAVCHAIEKDYLVHNIYLDTVIETNQYATPGMSTYNPEVKGYDYNLSAARALLAEAGYPDGFSTTYNYDSSADNADALAHALQDMLEKVQITLILNPVSNSVSTHMLQEGGGWHGIMGIFGSAQYDTLTQLYHYWIGEAKYCSMDKPDALIQLICGAITASEEDSIQDILLTQKSLVDEYCLCCYLFANTDYTVLAPTIHDSGFSSIMPVTNWTPADTWISAP
ncbi:ABC transporter substrate-binding protein [Hominifimenecus sp. rT4P-3]|uniref:ABC transporter substrate-binding protein n=1 Tax=Hominifimenecus sp. rT4P-3 TaxID=3242979 RepID=UPI003DA5CBB1